ncbi:MAG: TIGR01548 family HAD-type hydrolase [Planctomycetota bacterium]
MSAPRSTERSTRLDAGTTAAPARGPRPVDGLPARGPRPVDGLDVAYAAPRPGPPTDLWLAGNEGRAAVDLPACPAADLTRYPNAEALTEALAARFGVEPERVLVTAGADDALLRVALAYIGRGRALVLPTPTFEMIPRYVALAGGVVRELPWPRGPYPTDAVLARAEGAAAIAVVSPNNPTGAVASVAALRALAQAAPDALLVVDAAYAEFAAEDLTEAALALPNAVVLRTFSKAYGAAGLRVGYALGAPDVIRALRAAGNPYPVASPALAYALGALQADDGAARAGALSLTVQRAREARAALTEALERRGVEVAPSEGNFVLARLADPMRLRDLLAGLGIAVRAFPGRPELADALRITTPTTEADLARTLAALDTALAPEALLFDMDGVLADVSRSFRAAILATAAAFGAEVTEDDVQRAKDAGGANDDWSLTQRLMAARGVARSLAEVTARFEGLYQGTPQAPGLAATETLLAPRALFERLRARYRLAVVTGRPRRDAARFLAEHGLADLFPVVVTREDAPLKPDPAPVTRALTALGVTRAWMVGDTPDDVRAARAAGVVPIGVLAPPTSSLAEPAAAARSRATLTASGAARVLDSVNELETLLR